MAYEIGKQYHFMAYGGEGLCLNVYGNESIAQNRNVCLWGWSDTNAQSWVVRAEGGYGKIYNALADEQYALNIFRGSANYGNCDVAMARGNDFDSLLDLLTVNRDENLYRVRLANYNLYLTATGGVNGADVRWKAPTGGSDQLWRLVENSETERPDGTVDERLLKAMVSGYVDFAENAEGVRVQIPYRWAKKWSPAQIGDNLARLFGVPPRTQTAGAVQSMMDANKDMCGVDCSGLVYYCLNEAAGGAVRTYMEQVLGLPGRLSYAHGISAAVLASSQYGRLVRRAADVQPGDLIRYNNGGHVMIVFDVRRDAAGAVAEILYAHSSASGPHTGRIFIADAQQDIGAACQMWEDRDYEKPKALYNYTVRMGCFE